MLGRLATGFAAIFTFGRRADSLTGPAKVIDGDTIVVAGQLVRLHGIDAPELDQTFWWRGKQMVCGTMALAALEAITAGVKVRCHAVERDRHGRMVAKVFSPNGSKWAAGWCRRGGPWRTGGTRWIMSTPRTRQGQARDVEGQLREALGVARIVTAAAHAGTFEDSRDVRRQAGERQDPADVGHTFQLEDRSMKRAAIYAPGKHSRRASGPETQLLALRQVAERTGWQTVGEYVDL